LQPSSRGLGEGLEVALLVEVLQVAADGGGEQLVGEIHHDAVVTGCSGPVLVEHLSPTGRATIPDHTSGGRHLAAMAAATLAAFKCAG